MIHRSLIAISLLVAFAVAPLAGPAAAVKDPLVVCVTEPCGPQVPGACDTKYTESACETVECVKERCYIQCVRDCDGDATQAQNPPQCVRAPCGPLPGSACDTKYTERACDTVDCLKSECWIQCAAPGVQDCDGTTQAAPEVPPVNCGIWSCEDMICHTLRPGCDVAAPVRDLLP